MDGYILDTKKKTIDCDYLSIIKYNVTEKTEYFYKSIAVTQDSLSFFYQIVKYFWSVIKKFPI